MGALNRKEDRTIGGEDEVVDASLLTPATLAKPVAAGHKHES
jgi:hypothetical protein